MSIKTIISSLAIVLSLSASATITENLPEKTPAFPGAEGFGRYTTGGRGGKVYHVTKLDDDSSVGTLRWANSQTGPRTIVFDVSGTIHLKSALRLAENTTIAGQTAPGDGICLADYPVSVASNSIIRYIRFRLGNINVTLDGADGWDGLSCMDSHDVIIDHCSVSWSIDECCSVLGSVNTTVQWTLVAQSLVNSGHSKGAHGYGGNWGGSGASFHHNMIIHHSSRTPRLGPRPTTQEDERMDMRNNVIYNFGGNGCYGGEAMHVNIVNNYYKPGPGSPSGTKGKRIAGVGIRTKSYCTTYPAYSPMLDIWGTYFVEGNFNNKYADVTADNWTYGMYNQIDTSTSATDGTWNDAVKKSLKLDQPIDFVVTTTHSAEVAYERVLDYVGASLSRDSFDEQMIKDTRSTTASATGSGLSKGFINSQNDNKTLMETNGGSAWPVLNSTAAAADKDGDGIPDEWELENGLDPNNAADGNYVNDNGYTMLELYLADLVADITEAQEEGGHYEGNIVSVDPIEDEYVLCYDTRVGTSTTWTGRFTNGITVTNTQGGSYSWYRNNYMRFARDHQHYFALPQGAEIYRIEVVGKGRYATETLSDVSLVELNGEEFDTGMYTLPDNNATDDGKIDVTLTRAARNGLTMTFKGNNPDISRLTLFARAASSGIEDIVIDQQPVDEYWYNLQGIRLGTERPAAPGIYINNGKKILIK